MSSTMMPWSFSLTAIESQTTSSWRGSPKNRSGREGFQIVSDVRGHKLTASSEFSNNDWQVATSRVADGYIVEFEIPLALIDTADGAPYVPATTGSFLWFNAALTDNDSPVHAQEKYGPLWVTGPAGIGGQSPALLGEKAWRVGLSLSAAQAAQLVAPSDGGPPRRVLEYNGESAPVWSLALHSGRPHPRLRPKWVRSLVGP